MGVKVFRLNDYEWWAGETLEETQQAYLKQTGVDESEAFEDPYEISDEEMDTLTVVTDYERSERRLTTFRQALNELINKGQKFPCIFASTIW